MDTLNPFWSVKARWALAVALLVLGSCKSPERKSATTEVPSSNKRRNLVVVTIDTVRPDHLGCYGYTRIKTPNLDKLAATGALFENAVSQAPLTAPSHASMFTGTYPPIHKVRDTGGFILEPENTTIAEVLEQQGWDTAAFVGASVLKKSFGFAQGFSVYDDQMPQPRAGGMATEYPERRASEVVDRAINWLDSRSEKPFFLWVHLFDAHTPYDPPSPFKEEYKERPYDGEVAYVDQQLGRLLDGIGRKSAPENTLIVVLSDHGESLSDHGEFTHGIFLYDSTLRIALVMAGPNVPKGIRVKEQARTIDLSPTLFTLLGVKGSEGVQGVSLAPAFTGKMVSDFSYAETLFSKINMGWAELRAIRTNRWKYIRAPKAELYDLQQDPGESSNVIDAHPSEAKELEAKLRSVIGSGTSDEKVSTAMIDRHTSEQLRSLGYTGGAHQREYQLTGKGINPKDRVEVLKLLQLAMSPESRIPRPQRISLLRRALTLDPANPTIYYDLGGEYDKAGHPDEAMALYRAGIKNGIDTAWLYSRLGNLYLRQGNMNEAIGSFERAAQLNPSDSESLSDLATAYLETGRVGDGERVFRWALATAGDYAPAHNGLGLVAVRKEDMNAARGHFEKAVQLDPNLFEAQLNLGRLYKMTGDSARARKCFETFLAKAPLAEYRDIIPKVKAELASMP